MISDKRRKRFITEEDISQILQRYSATTVLSLLQEVDQYSDGSPDGKIDWHALVKKTSTGISSSREYQMLWRHIAYNNSLIDKLEDSAEILDDDSDLEIEIEPFPPVSTEAAAEAAACVKILRSSGLSNDPSTTNRPTVEAPLTINIPNGHASVASDKQSIHCLNITIPVSVHKQPLPSVSLAEGPEGSGPASSRQPAKKKRKLWSREEDSELIAAVKKCGEGNWQNILKEDFKHERTASQLSQRWSTLRKNCGKSPAGANGNSNNSTLSEAQLSARQAISMALNMPTIGSLSAISSGTMMSNTPSSSSLPTVPNEASPLFSEKPSQSQQVLQQTNSQKGVSSAPTTLRTVQTKPSTGPNPLIQKAAFAAGGRIANPSTAASLLKAAQSKNAVHIRHMGTFPMSQAPVSKSSSATISAALRPSNTAQSRVSPSVNAMPANVSGSVSQQACNPNKPSLQNAPGTAALHRSSTQHLPAESTSPNPVHDNTCGSINNKNIPAGPDTVVSLLSAVDGGLDQPKDHSLAGRDEGNASKLTEIDGCTEAAHTSPDRLENCDADAV